MNKPKFNKTKNVKKKKKGHSTYMECVLCWPTIPWYWALPWNVVGISSMTPLEKADFTLVRRQLSVATSFQGVISSPHFPFVSTGVLPGLNQHISCMCCLNICEFICVSLLLYLQTLASLVSPGS